jgi:alkanesulfonate monooxygenase SsuD/methylene tetrahydromethanopterin reductase-like flavin-dependent oxidoreductase (luciferase family)
MRERFDRFEEGLEVLESLLSNDRTSFRGQHYVLTEAMNNPKPVQQPLPLCIGGRGRKRTIPLAARYANHWNFSGQDLNEFAECRTVLRDSCAAIGRDPDEITCSMLMRYEGDDDAIRNNVAAMEAALVDLVIVTVPKSEPPTVIERIAEAIG